MKNPLSFLFKAAPDRRASDSPRAPDLLWVNPDVSAVIVQYKDYVNAETAMKHPIVYRALNKIAESVSTVRWFAETDPLASPSDKRGKASVIRDLDALLSNPNDDMSPAQLRYWMALNYAVYGRVPFKVSFSAVQDTRANGIFPLEVKYVRAKLNIRGGVDYYEYGSTDKAETLPSKAKANPGQSFAADIWKPGLKGRPDAKDISSPLDAVCLPAAVITELLKRAIATAMGHPNARYLVVAEKTLTEPQKAALKRHLESFETDGEHSGGIPVIQNAGKIDIHTLDNNLSDIHSRMPLNDMGKIIAGAFGIPSALMGLDSGDGAKFASNFIESRRSFFEDTVIPGYLSPISDGLTKALCPPGVRVQFDLDTIPAIVQVRMATAATLQPVTFLTDVEKRELIGFQGPAPTIEANQEDDL